jgi:type II restriction enzyme
VLGNIPPDARIPVVVEGVARSPEAVRKQYARLRPLAGLPHTARGWTLDMLNVVRSIGREEFSLADVYARAAGLERLHPENRHVQQKVRQQLQRLRDLGFLEFLGGGRYRLM